MDIKELKRSLDSYSKRTDDLWRSLWLWLSIDKNKRAWKRSGESKPLGR